LFGRRHGLTQHEHSSRHVSASQPVLFGLRFFFFFFLSFRCATSGFFLSAESPHRSLRGDAAMRFASPTPISSARSRDALFVIRVSSTKKVYCVRASCVVASSSSRFSSSSLHHRDASSRPAQLAHEDGEELVVFVLWAIRFVRQVSDASAGVAPEPTIVVALLARHRTVHAVTSAQAAVGAGRVRALDPRVSARLPTKDGKWRRLCRVARLITYRV